MEQKQRAQIDELLFQVLRAIFHYERSIAAGYGLDFQQIYALQHLRRNPNARLTEIAAEMELPKFSVSRLLNGLVKKGYIIKSQDSTDRRNYHLSLEAKGEQIVQSIEAASYTRISNNSQGLPPQAVNELIEVAERLPMVLGVNDQFNRQ